MKNIASSWSLWIFVKVVISELLLKLSSPQLQTNVKIIEQ